MKLFNKVAIVGVGLIGGSMALAIKRKGLAREVVGVSRHKSTLSLAKKNRVIDRGSQGLDIIKGADLVILATPVNTILRLAPDIFRLIPAGSIVTDVGSTKKEIAACLSKIFPNYVASHPLAGSEKRGVNNACAGIFKNSLCILTPTGKTNPKALKKIGRLWHELGARIVFLRPDIHDKALAFVSHLPHAIAFSLIGAIPGEYLKLGANSLKDTTRIALSDSCLWADIFLSNRKNMLEAIESFQGSLFRIKSAIQKKDRKMLIKILKEAKKKRDILN
ncbi:MAG: prephenate dehydrogenase [Candidatus Omnitrophica bacterium]|nr:prephenate dehydrogenase [Candidatus Omnitrophota bacterium]MDD5592566.1 prephenate dehydrogenase [Candidatus Omnitrophota bacterium]